MIQFDFISIVAGIFIGLVFSSFLPDFNYFFLNFLLKFIRKREGCGICYESKSPSVVLPGDVDRSKHMNNSRYIR
jgi:hypothetical protein